MRSDAAVDVENFDFVFSGEITAGLLIGRVLLIRAGRIAVESEKCFRGIGHADTGLSNVLHDVGAAEIPGDSRIDDYINDVARRDVAAGMRSENFFNNGFTHGIDPVRGRSVDARRSSYSAAIIASVI